MASETVENYLKAIYLLACPLPVASETPSVRPPAAAMDTPQVSLGDLAIAVGVTPGTATAMVKRLAADGLAVYQRYGGVVLTAKGSLAAVDILRRHRLIQTFLVKTLKLDWSQVHAEAERLEHAISPLVLAALDAHLGFPAIDPHGDPIPDPSGMIHGPRGTPLCQFAAGSRFRVSRIADQDADFLSFIGASGLKPGQCAAVLAVNPAAQSMSVQADGCVPVSMATGIAMKIIVESLEG